VLLLRDNIPALLRWEMFMLRGISRPNQESQRDNVTRTPIHRMSLWLGCLINTLREAFDGIDALAEL
jgi:hypothetical protein